MRKFIAVDLGTTLIKCVLFDEKGQTVKTDSVRCNLEYPKQGFVEQEPSVWYEGVCEAIKRLTSDCDPKEVVGLSVSSQGISVVPVDREFRPLAKAISWLDNRGEKEIRFILEQLPEETWIARTGKNPRAGWSLAKLLWYKNNEPDLFEKAYKFLMPMDYLNARMTGCPVTDHTMASGMMCHDIRKEDWDDEILEKTGIKREKLPELMPSGSFIGTFNEETVQRTGLSAETKVFNGGQDQKVAAYAAGVDETHVSLSLGTAGTMEVFVEEPEKQRAITFCPYVESGKIVVECCISTTGAAVQWMKDTICSDIDFEEVNRLADAAPAGCNGVRFYPHLGRPGTPHMGRKEYGSIREISLGTTRGELIRSLYEGLAYEVRLNLEAAKAIGSKVQELILFGGVSKSDVFCKILTNVTNLEFYVAENGEMGAIGAAKFAVRGEGLDEAAFAEAAAGGKRKFSPDEETVAVYEKLYQEYIKYYQES